MSNSMPNPGSQEARELGCTCPVMDNGYGKGSGRVDEEGRPLFWKCGDCPLHGNEEEVRHG